MGVPAVAGDQGAAYTFPSTPPVVSSAQIIQGSVKTFIGSKSIALLGQTTTSLGPIGAASAVTVQTFIEGKPVILIGAVTNLATGWIGGTLVGAGAGAVQMT